jgi:hypothetical protein
MKSEPVAFRMTSGPPAAPPNRDLLGPRRPDFLSSNKRAEPEVSALCRHTSRSIYNETDEGNQANHSGKKLCRRVAEEYGLSATAKGDTEWFNRKNYGLSPTGLKDLVVALLARLLRLPLLRRLVQSSFLAPYRRQFPTSPNKTA